jgi:hypothetical protein
MSVALLAGSAPPFWLGLILVLLSARQDHPIQQEIVLSLVRRVEIIEVVFRVLPPGGPPRLRPLTKSQVRNIIQAFVERFFAWTNRNRQLAKDSDAIIASAQSFLYTESVMLLTRRLARSK